MTCEGVGRNCRFLSRLLDGSGLLLLETYNAVASGVGFAFLLIALVLYDALREVSFPNVTFAFACGIVVLPPCFFYVCSFGVFSLSRSGRGSFRRRGESVGSFSISSLDFRVFHNPGVRQAKMTRNGVWLRKNADSQRPTSSPPKGNRFRKQ